jgi:hypothetical protein
MIVVEYHWVHALSRDFPWSEWTGLAPVNPTMIVMLSMPCYTFGSRRSLPLLMTDFRASNRDIEIKPAVALENMRALGDPIAYATPAIYHIMGQAPAGIGIDLARDDDDGMARLLLENLGIGDKVGCRDPEFTVFVPVELEDHQQGHDYE